MKVFVFSSESRANSSLAFDYGKWAFKTPISWGQEAVDRHLPKGSFGLIYTAGYGLGYPFFTKSVPQVNEEIEDIPWIGIWHSPFDIVTLSNEVIPTEELTEVLGPLNKFMATCRGVCQLNEKEIDSDFILDNLL
jgi:hypothetical protein